MKETKTINDFIFYVENLYEWHSIFPTKFSTSIFSPNYICPPAQCQVVEGAEEIIISVLAVDSSGIRHFYEVCVCKFCYCVKLIKQ